MTVAIALWAMAATAVAKHLTLMPRVRAAQLMLGALTPIAVTVTLVTLDLWWSVTQFPAVAGRGSGPARHWRACPRGYEYEWAAQKGRRLRAAASGATVVNPSAQRTHGRHRA